MSLAERKRLQGLISNKRSQLYKLLRPGKVPRYPAPARKARKSKKSRKSRKTHKSVRHGGVRKRRSSRRGTPSLTFVVGKK
jgi:hypothetical protein